MTNKNLRYIYQNFAYENKFVYPKIIIAFRDFILTTQKPPKISEHEYNQRLVKLSTCFECMTLGFFLHDQLGGKKYPKSCYLT